MIETPLYTDIEMEGEKIHKWKFHQISNDCRFHFKLLEGCGGFEFCSVNWTGNVCNEEKDQWKNKTTTVEVLLHGRALFDGIRHLHFGTDKSKNEGYFYYPDMDTLFLIMEKLVDMEEEFCEQADKRKYLITKDK